MYYLLYYDASPAFDLYDLGPLVSKSEAPVHVKVSSTVEGMALTGRIDVYKNFVFVNNGTEIFPYMITMKFEEAIIDSLLPINGTTIDFEFSRTSPIEWSDFNIMGFTEHLCLLMIYEEGERGLFTISLTDELKEDSDILLKKEFWNLKYSPEDNHYGGSPGTVYLASSRLNEHYLKKQNLIDINEKSLFYLGMDDFELNLRQGLVDTEGYAYLYQYQRDCD